MICKVCRSIADHPSNENEALAHCVLDGCTCKHRPTIWPVESLYDGSTVDLEWVRSRRTMDYSKQVTA